MSVSNNIVCVIFKKQKTCTVFVSSYTNTSGSLGEREMLWEHEPQTRAWTESLEQANRKATEMHYNSRLSYCSRCSLRLRSTAPYLDLLLHHQCLENCWGEVLQLSFVRSSRLRLTASHLNYHWHLTQTLQHRICSVTLQPESAKLIKVKFGR